MKYLPENLLRIFLIIPSIAILLTAGINTASSQTPVLIKDINSTLTSATTAFVGDITDDGTFYFIAYDKEHGEELWKSDGTGNGTTMVADVNPGTPSSAINSIIAFGNSVVFFADDGIHGREPWISDGSESGTLLLADLYAGSQSSNPAFLTTGGDSPIQRIFFYAQSDIYGNEVIQTDGTPAGTLVIDFNLGITGSNPTYLAGDAGGLYFNGNTAAGMELIYYDIVSDVASLVSDINPGMSSSNPRYLTVNPNNNILFFSADNGTSGNELWKCSSGVVSQVADLEAGAANSFVTDIFPFNNGVIFTTGQSSTPNDLYYYDNISAPVALGDFFPLTASVVSDRIYSGIQRGSKFFFDAVTNPTYGNELFVTDGTPVGTGIVKDINPGLSSSNIVSPAADPSNPNQLLFLAYDPGNGEEIWKTDGTPTGTVLFNDFTEGAAGTPTRGIFSNGLITYLLLRSPQDSLWTTDGNLSNTNQVKILTDSATSESSSPAEFTQFNDSVYFSAFENTHGSELWRTDVSSTGLINDLYPGLISSGISSLTAAAGKLFFTAESSSTSFELFVSDGTTSGTGLLKDIYPGTNTSAISRITPAATGIYFVANDGSHGNELWFSNGTESGTVLVDDTNPGISGTSIRTHFKTC